MPAPTHLLYLHGFRSSPRSYKAQRMRAWLAAHRPDLRFECPALPPSPRAAMALVAERTRGWPADASAVIGSSLGGFYATHVARTRGWPAVVLNPAVDPARDLAAHLGTQPVWGSPDESIHFEPAYIDELRALTEPPPWTPLPRLRAIIATGDEVLDFGQMWARYEGSDRIRIDGSDHALSDFDTHLPRVVEFLGLAAPDIPTAT